MAPIKCAGERETAMAEKILINNDWKFLHGDFSEGAVSDYDDAEWYDIGLPHSFGIPYFMENEFYIGYGCYRKHIVVEEKWLQKKVYIEFQGVFQETEVYINGRLAGSHKGGYTAFLIEITPYLHIGDNLIFVRVNNLWNPRIAPRGGEHVFNGGIYRDVSLLIFNPVHIAWYGTFVTTPEVNEKRAKVKIRTDVCNDTEAEAKCRLISEIYFGNKKVAECVKDEIVSPREKRVYEQETEVVDPNLWHPDTPFLYTLKSIFLMNEEVADVFRTDFGIRWFSFTSDEGFFLNGEHYDIHGANVHQDHAGWSDAVTHTGIRRDIEMVKGCGMNFIRGSHYPHHTYFAEECDRQGVLFWSENCFWGTGGPKEEGYWSASAYPVKEEDEREFEESCVSTLAEMIHTNRNHPSIIVWSMCNEPFFSNMEVMDKAKGLVKRLVACSHELDPTRPAAAGGVQREGFDTIGDLAGYNGDGAVLFVNPGFPNFVSEYGSVVEDRPGRYESRYRDKVERNPAWRSGKSLWCAFHHGSIFGSMGHMGIIDYYRLPLSSWYWYREHLLGVAPPKEVKKGIPYRVCIKADRKKMKGNGTEDVLLVVFVADAEGERVSNAPDVELEVVSGGGVFPTGKRFTFSAEKGNFAEGLGAIELHAWHRGNTYIHGRSAGLESAELCICVTDGSEMREEGIKELMPPPCVTGARKKKDIYDIAINRPIACSSASSGHLGKNVTDAQLDTWWFPIKTEAGEWVQVDLEGSKEILRLGISFIEPINERFEIECSDDGQDYRSIYISNKESTFLELNLDNVKTRYVRIRFCGKPVGVSKIELWA